MPHYIALIHKDIGSDYGVSFPDFPGLATAGHSLDEARAMAEEALAFHVEGMIEDGEALPEPTALDEVMRDPENHDGVVTLISLKPSPKRAVRVNVTLPEDVLADIDRYAESHGLSRSGFLARAAKRAMEEPVE
ncbi:MAG TPA: type II toxin-antitoxin system HicB family antitoxin [Stellaceae bacterium]|jgi:predicted RNase H-like HicB family nuclease|nr:type II toxin-antitoxin system HicB family antitoxin [Stellaceae bacterium]